MSFKLNPLPEVKQGIKAAANKPVFPSDSKGSSITRSRLSSAPHTLPTLTSFPQLDMYQGGFCLAVSEARRILITRPRLASSLKHVNIKRG